MRQGTVGEHGDAGDEHVVDALGQEHRERVRRAGRHTRRVHDDEVRFGTSPDRVQVVDRQGAPLGIDNYGRLVKTFETKDGGQLDPLLDALETVLGLLQAEGLEAFPAYGTLPA